LGRIMAQDLKELRLKQVFIDALGNEKLPWLV
jgi:hypothetical protein